MILSRENPAGYTWTIVEKTWLNSLGTILLLTMDINKRCCRLFIWYTFKIFNFFINNLSGIEILSENISLVAWSCFPRIHSRLVLFVLAYVISAWLYMAAKNIFRRGVEFKKQLALNRLPSSFGILFSTNSKWVFQVKFSLIITPKIFSESSFLNWGLLLIKSGWNRRGLSLHFTLWTNTYLVLSVFEEMFMHPLINKILLEPLKHKVWWLLFWK